MVEGVRGSRDDHCEGPEIFPSGGKVPGAVGIFSRADREYSGAV
jgi:hypothetical protein